MVELRINDKNMNTKSKCVIYGTAALVFISVEILNSDHLSDHLPEKVFYNNNIVEITNVATSAFVSASIFANTILHNKF